MRPDGSVRLECAASIIPTYDIDLYGESAGARTQDQRLKRAMLYQLSYALVPLLNGSTFICVNSYSTVRLLMYPQLLL